MSETLDLDAFREWQSWPEERRQLYLNNAFCPECGQAGKGFVTSFAKGCTIRKEKYRLVIDGQCVRYGSRIARCCD